MRDLAPMLPTAARSPAPTPNEDVIARVREAANWIDKPPTVDRRAGGLPMLTGIKLAYAGDGTAGSLCRFRSAHRS